MRGKRGEGEREGAGESDPRPPTASQPIVINQTLKEYRNGLRIEPRGNHRPPRRRRHRQSFRLVKVLHFGSEKQHLFQRVIRTQNKPLDALSLRSTPLQHRVGRGFPDRVASRGPIRRQLSPPGAIAPISVNTVLTRPATAPGLPAAPEPDVEQHPHREIADGKRAHRRPGRHVFTRLPCAVPARKA